MLAGVHEGTLAAVLVVIACIDMGARSSFICIDPFSRLGFASVHYILFYKFTIHQLTAFFVFAFRLILTTVLVTSKMFNDTYYTNQYIASIGGATLSNINHLERFFMYVIDWNLFVTEEEFDSYDRSLASYQHSG